MSRKWSDLRRRPEPDTCSVERIIRQTKLGSFFGSVIDDFCWCKHHLTLPSINSPQQIHTVDVQKAAHLALRSQPPENRGAEPTPGWMRYHQVGRGTTALCDITQGLFLKLDGAAREVKDVVGIDWQVDVACRKHW